MKTTCIAVLAWLARGVLPAQTPVPAQDAAQIEAAMTTGKRLASATVEIRRGFDQAARLNAPPPEYASTDAAGISRTSTRQWERIEVRPPRAGAAYFLGCLWVDSKCGSLPVGSSFDKATGTFYWHVPEAFKGDFDLVFHQPGSSPLVVRITAAPEVTTRLK